MKFCIKDFFSKCDQIRRNLQIWSHLLKKSLMEKFHFLCHDRASFAPCNTFIRDTRRAKRYYPTIEFAHFLTPTQKKHNLPM